MRYDTHIIKEAYPKCPEEPKEFIFKNFDYEGPQGECFTESDIYYYLDLAKKQCKEKYGYDIVNVFVSQIVGRMYGSDCYDDYGNFSHKDSCTKPYITIKIEMFVPDLDARWEKYKEELDQYDAECKEVDKRNNLKQIEKYKECIKYLEKEIEKLK